jgi:hypothetical protein
MSKLKMIGGIVLVIVIGVVAMGLISDGEINVIDDIEDEIDLSSEEEQEQTSEPDVETETPVNRYDKIPSSQGKMTPELDYHQPKLHSFLWEDPVILEGGINTAGAEDSPFVSPDGNSFYFFFTPDVSKPAEEQLTDGVTGIWVSRKVNGVWEEAELVDLTTLGPALDGCAYVSDEEIWFCSARMGNYKNIDFWKGTLTEDGVVDIQILSKELNTEVIVGELHVSRDGNTIYYHSDVAGGFGGMDIFKVTREGDGWGEPENIVALNTVEHDGYPYLSPDEDELWLNRWYMGSPGSFRSKRVDGEWSTPQVIVSAFAGEPNLDAEGNLYFTHHYYQDGQMLEADIYVAYRKQTVEPVDSISIPSRRFLLGMLPTPNENGDFDTSYAKASETSELVPIWGRPTPFWEKAEDLDSWWGETFVEDLTRDNGMYPLLHFSFIGEEITVASPPGTGYSLDSKEWRLMYKRAIIESVEVTKPAYLSIGKEVNRWYEKYGTEGNNGFQHWVSLYEEIYHEVKELSPETKVFCIFSREIVSEFREADMSVIEMFDPNTLDLLVLTSYPHSVSDVNLPSDIPSDYYTSVVDLIPGKPLAFSEVTWPSTGAFGGDQAQEDFIPLLVDELTQDQGVDLEFVMWPWLYDIGQDVGLIESNGDEKLGYSAWVEISAR